MKCADPVLCYTGKTRRVFRHFSLANPVFKLMHQQVFDCGKCIFCRKKKASELAMRCVLHASLYKQNCFITLTYDETKESYSNEFIYKEIQDFKKRYRNLFRVPYCTLSDKKVRHLYTRTIQIFNVHEYGRNGKKHWHLVVFNHDFNDKQLFTVKSGNNLYTSKTLGKLWPHGHHTIGDVTEASAMYQAQYTQKDFKYDHIGTSKKSHSKHSGIGRDYFMLHYAQILGLGYIPFNGKKIPVPRYFQKLAHKHYSHFYEPSNFYDNQYRKRLYTPFKDGDANRKIADLYQSYVEQKLFKLDQLSIDWENSIEDYIFNKQKPDFRKAAEIYLYDQKKKKDGDL